MNADIFDLAKLSKRRSQFSPDELAMFHRDAVMAAAAGQGKYREGAFPMLSPLEAERRNVLDPIRQTMAIIRDCHPGPAWKSPEFVDTVEDILKARWSEMLAAQQKALVPASETKRIGGRFDAPKQLADKWNLPNE